MGPVTALGSSGPPRSKGTTASTIVGCCNPSAKSRLLNRTINIMLPRDASIPELDSQPKASSRHRAVHTTQSLEMHSVPTIETFREF